MKFVLVGLPLICVISLMAQKTSFDPGRRYHPDSLKSWTKSVMLEMSEKHPGFYRYTPKEKFDKLIDSTCQSISVPLT
jgi:hypothetical protein